MPPITLHFFHASPPCRSVLLTLKVLNLDATFKDIDFFGEQKHLQPEFLKLNPAHTVPLMQDNDVFIWESRSIMRYLVSMYGGENDELYPSDPKERAQVDKMLDFDLGTLYRSLEIYFEVYMFTEREPSEEELSKVTHNIKILDEILQITPYASGNHVTISDISLAVTMTSADALLIDYSSCEHVRLWLQKIKTEFPFFDQVNRDGWQQFKDYFDEKKKKFVGK